MSKYIKVFFLFFFQTIFTFSQESVCHLNYKTTSNIGNCLSNYSNTSMQTSFFIREILKKTGIPDSNFILSNCSNTNNAIALIYNYKRYIIVDELFVDYLSSENNLVNIFILSHEIGHHLNGHTLERINSLEESRQKELESDMFAGFVVKKFNGTKEDIYKALSAIKNPVENNSTHPIFEDRLKSAYKGFDSALEEEFKIINSYSSFLKNYYKKHFYEIDLNRARESKLDFMLSNNKSHLENSLNYYLKIIGEKQSDPQLYEELSDVYFMNEDYYNSMISSEKAYDLSKDNKHLIFAHARCNSAIDNNVINKSACDKYNKKLLDINYLEIQDPKYLLQLGKFYAIQNDLDKSEQILLSAYENIKKDKFIDFFDKHMLSDILNDLSVTQLRKSNYKLAYSNLIESIKLSDELSTYYDYYQNINNYNINVQIFNRSILENRLNMWDQSNASCISLKSKNEDLFTKCYSILGSNYHNLKKYKDAIEFYNQAIKLENDLDLLAYYYYLRGLSKISLKNKESGCNDIKIAIDKGYSEAIDKHKILCTN